MSDFSDEVVAYEQRHKEIKEEVFKKFKKNLENIT